MDQTGSTDSYPHHMRVVLHYFNIYQVGQFLQQSIPAIQQIVRHTAGGRYFPDLNIEIGQSGSQRVDLVHFKGDTLVDVIPKTLQLGSGVLYGFHQHISPLNNNFPYRCNFRLPTQILERIPKKVESMMNAILAWFVEKQLNLGKAVAKCVPIT